MDASNPSRPRKKASALSLGSQIGAVIGPALVARGLAQSSLIAHWPEIVGRDVAMFARFERLNWPPRADKRDPAAQSAPATLVLRIDSAFAVEAQHLSRQIVERVNAHFGWRCVGGVAFRQGPLPQPAHPRRVLPPHPDSLSTAREMVGGLEDESLREAAARLGARVFDRKRRVQNS